MPTPPVENSFAGSRTKVGNAAVRSVVDELMAFRQQLTLKPQLEQVGGWDDPLNHWLVEETNRVRHSLALVTTEQSEAPDQGARREARAEQAADETRDLAARYDGANNPISADDILMPRRKDSTLPYDFSGADKRWPQLRGNPKYKNTHLVQFCDELDSTVKELTNLACQGNGYTIPQQQSAMIAAKLDGMFAICVTKGGKANMREIADGTDPYEAEAEDVVNGTITDPTETT